MPKLKTLPWIGLALTLILTASAMSCSSIGKKNRTPQSTYEGHGDGSIDPEQIARFAPPALPNELSRKIQSMLDIRAPGMGMPDPSGKKLYFGWSVTGTRQVWRLDSPQGFPVQMTGGEDATSLQTVTPDGQWLVLSRDQKGQENPGLYLQPTQGGPLQVIRHKPGVQTLFQFVTSDSAFVYFASNDIQADSYAIYRYSIGDRKTELLFSEAGKWGIADFKNDGTLLLQKATGALTSEVYELNPARGKLIPVLGQGEREEYSIAYGAHPGELLVLTPKFGDFRKLYRMKDGKFTPLSPDLKADVSEFSIDRAKKRIVYHLNDQGYTRSHALNASSYTEVRLPDFRNADHVFAGSMTLDGRYLTIGVITASAPQTSYVYDWETEKLVQWVVPSAPEIDTRNFARASLEHYPARDGTPIPMLVRRPPGCENRSCPVIVDFHGGPEGQSTPGFSVYAQMIVDAGFVLVQPNVRGSDGYGKSWLSADDGRKRLKVITDIEDCALFIRKHWTQGGRVPKIGISGGSYGGYSTLMGMSRFAGAYDAGVAIVGMSNLVTFLKNTAPYRRTLRISEYGDPEKDYEALVQLSPMTYLDQIKAPLMIIQGVSDPRVPAGEAVQIHEALAAKGISSQLILFADEGHGAQKRGNQVLQFGHLIQFFQKHLN